MPTRAVHSAVHKAPIDLQPGAVYLSPRGLRCRWWPDPRWSVARSIEVAAHALFVYDTPAGTASVDSLHGFTLSRANWPLLRRAS